MRNRLGRFVESVVFAGLKPDARVSQAPRGRWLAPLRGWLEKLLAGRAPTDPLYVTNRTWKQKLRLSLIVGVPCVALASTVALALSSLFPHEPALTREPAASEIMARLLPDLDKTVNVNISPDAELAEVRVVQGDAPRLSGLLTNKTTGAISIEFVLDLTDANGSRLGAVTERVDNIPARSAAPFDFVLRQSGVAFATVRKIRTLR
jgi:hypothetical protein